MNKLTAEVNGWTNRKLSEACQEIIDFKNTGVLKSGHESHVRELAKFVGEETGDNALSNLSIAEDLIRTEAMNRYVALVDSFKLIA